MIKIKKVITYGTFDLLHNGHINLLKRAKALGDYLIVGVTTENYDRNRGKLNIQNSLMKRIEDVKSTGYADEIIIEEYYGQKIDDIQKYGVDIFAIGSDWLGQFDYLKDFCEIVYLERTKGVSSTQLRNEKSKILNIGIIGCGRIANRFIEESKYVSGIEVVGVYNPDEEEAKKFSERHELKFFSNDLTFFINNIDAVYIASPHLSHSEYIRTMLENGKHVLCEKPMTLYSSELEEYYSLAKEKSLVLLEAIKTAYCPAFNHLVSLIKSGKIGTIKDIEASFTKLQPRNTREFFKDAAGGSMTELSSYPLLPIIKFLGDKYVNLTFYSDCDEEVDLFTRGVIQYSNSVATFKVGLGVKTEGCLIISGTKGYAYVPAPWWKTESFELRYEDFSETQKYFYKFDGDGLRYEIHEFLKLIQSNTITTHKLMPAESIAINKVIEKFREGNEVKSISSSNEKVIPTASN